MPRVRQIKIRLDLLAETLSEYYSVVCTHAYATGKNGEFVAMHVFPLFSRIKNISAWVAEWWWGEKEVV